MIHRRVLTALLGAGLLVGGGFAVSGCGGDEGQASRRDTVWAPRDKGGVVAPGVDPKGKGAKGGGKLGGKSGRD